MSLILWDRGWIFPLILLPGSTWIWWAARLVHPGCDETTLDNEWTSLQACFSCCGVKLVLNCIIPAWAVGPACTPSSHLGGYKEGLWKLP